MYRRRITGGVRRRYRRTTRRSYRPRRGYVRRTRVRRTYGRRRLYKRRILNTSTVKKRDDILPWTNFTQNDTNTSGQETFSRDSAVFRGLALQVTPGGITDQVRAQYTTVFCPTARLPYATSTDIGNFAQRFNSTTRTTSDPYYVGYKESISIVTTSRTPWEWRRICFTSKGYAERFRTVRSHQSPTTDPADFSIGSLLPTGPARLMTQLTFQGNPGDTNDLFQLIFQGVYGSDYADLFTARTNNNLVKICYDKTRILQSTNDAYHIHKINIWHPMRGRLMYNDTESGGTIVPSAYSAPGRKGMGDYVIVDFFRIAGGNGAEDQMVFTPTGTLYWHEK